MNSKVSYRVWQFWQGFKRSPREGDQEALNTILFPEEQHLFQQLPAADQNHSLRVFRSLQIQGEDDPDLLKAALLHDLGKTRYPLRRWERVFAVLAAGLFPRRAQVWGEGKATGLRRPLVIIKQHPQWGADLAQSAGSNPRTVWFIRNHERDLPEGSSSDEELILLRKLQTADNTN
ncbi:MAG: HD domain-containing protein [Anaerolineales bacterium]|nr:HD domain-containing protein [Anaerolineales bacterium]